MWRALESEVGPQEEAEAAVRLLDELAPPGDDESAAQMRPQLADWEACAAVSQLLQVWDVVEGAGAHAEGAWRSR